MTDVGRLRWILEVDSEKFNRGLAAAQRRMSSFVDRAVSLRTAGVIGGAAAGLATSAVRTSTGLTRRSRITGIDPETLQRLDRVISSFGGGIESIDQFAEQLGELQQAEPGGELFSALKEMGFPQYIRQIRETTDAFEALMLVLEVARQLPSAQQRTRFAAAAGLSPEILASNRQAIESQMEQVNRLTIISNENATALERLNAQLGDMGRNLRGFAEAAMSNQLNMYSFIREGPNVAPTVEQAGRVPDWVTNSVIATTRESP